VTDSRCQPVVAPHLKSELEVGLKLKLTERYTSAKAYRAFCHFSGLFQRSP